MYDGCYMHPKKKAKTVKRKPLLRETVASRGRPISLPGPDMIPPVLQRTRVHPGFGPRSAQNLNAAPSSVVDQSAQNLNAGPSSVVERIPASHVSVVKYPFGGNYVESPSTAKTSPKTAASMDSSDRMVIDDDSNNDLAQILKHTRIIGHGMEYRNVPKPPPPPPTPPIVAKFSPATPDSDTNMYSPNVMVNASEDRLKDLNLSKEQTRIIDRSMEYRNVPKPPPPPPIVTKFSPTTPDSDTNMYSPNVMVNASEDRLKDLNLSSATSTERARNEQFGNPDIQSAGAKGFQTEGGPLPFTDQLKQGVVLRKTPEQKKDVSILDQIRAGAKLKQVGQTRGSPLSITDQLKQGVELRKTTEQKPLSPKKNDFLDQIRGGVKLKQADVNKKPVPEGDLLIRALGNKKPGLVGDLFSQALSKRRAAIEDDEEDDGAFD